MQTYLQLRKEGYVHAKSTLKEVTAEETMRATCARLSVPKPAQEFFDKAMEAFFAYEEACWMTAPEALPLLKELSQRGLRLGMFSNASDAKVIQRLVQRFGFDQSLHPALSSPQTGIRKPDPKAFEPILQTWDVAPEAVVMAGDSLDADILGAQQAGMHNIWLKTAERARPDGSVDKFDEIIPEMEVERLSEIPDCLEKLLS